MEPKPIVAHIGILLMNSCNIDIYIFLATIIICSLSTLNWFEFFKQGQRQSKESARPRLMYSHKAKASERCEISFYL